MIQVWFMGTLDDGDNQFAVDPDPVTARPIEYFRQWQSAVDYIWQLMRNLPGFGWSLYMLPATHDRAVVGALHIIRSTEDAPSGGVELMHAVPGPELYHALGAHLRMMASQA